MRALLPASVLVVAAVFAAPAGGERQADLLVRHGESIGKLKLGMTLPQVRRLLGPERAVIERERRGTRGYAYLDLEWDYGWWTVGFMRPPDGRYRAVRITTLDHRQRTPEGVGPRSTADRLFARVRGLTCRTVYRTDRMASHVECVRRAGRSRQTVFLFGAPRPRSGTATCTYVETVEVRDRPFYRAWPVRIEPYQGSWPNESC